MNQTLSQLTLKWSMVENLNSVLAEVGTKDLFAGVRKL
jgi:hypothetical protein